MVIGAIPSLTWVAGFPTFVSPVGADKTVEDLLTALGNGAGTEVRERLRQDGAVVLSGFQIRTLDDFEMAAKELLGSLAPYRGGDAPRRAERGNVYNAEGTDKSRLLRAHNELSYAPWYPMTLCFGCVRPADIGGATVLWDGRRVYDVLPEKVRRDFRERGVMYVQHLPIESGSVSGVKSWQETFESDRRDEVMRHCAEVYTSARWTDIGLLTTNVTPGTLRLDDGRETWFNQSHIWQKDRSLIPDVTDFELWNTYLGYGVMFGDGTAIPEGHMEEVKRALSECAVPIRWRSGDVLLIDNRAVMHGREPFEGERKVFVAFA